jgi:hypothetical protein
MHAGLGDDLEGLDTGRACPVAGKGDKRHYRNHQPELTRPKPRPEIKPTNAFINIHGNT